MPANYLPYARVTTGNPQTTLDATAQNPVGAMWAPPTPYNNGIFSTTAGSSTPGLGAPPVFKYVYFYDASALTGTAQSAPAPVYWIDESFTTVTPNPADGLWTAGGAAVAGYWMPNTTALGTSNTAAQWYAQFVQSYGWIQIGGLVSGAYIGTVTNAALGNNVYGATTTAWNSIVNTPTASIAANITRFLGVQVSAISNTNYADVLVGGIDVFWGS